MQLGALAVRVEIISTEPRPLSGLHARGRDLAELITGATRCPIQRSHRGQG